jgi:hypothetical protein
MVRLPVLAGVFVAVLATPAFANPTGLRESSLPPTPADAAEGRAIQAEINELTRLIWSRYGGSGTQSSGGGSGWLARALASSPYPGSAGQVSPLAGSYSGFGRSSLYSGGGYRVGPRAAAFREKQALFARRAALKARLARSSRPGI